MQNVRVFKPERTAIKRPGSSLPLRVLFCKGLIYPTDSVLDYGCGYGGDVKVLKKRQAREVMGYDPCQPKELGFSEFPSGKLFDEILCTYVLNVVHVDEEEKIFLQIESVMHPLSAAYFSVRRDIVKEGVIVRHADGSYHIQRYVELPEKWFTLVYENSKFAIYGTSRTSLRSYLKEYYDHDC